MNYLLILLYTLGTQYTSLNSYIRARRMDFNYINFTTYNFLTTLDFPYQDAKIIITKDIHDQKENKWSKLSTKLHEI